MTPEEIKELEAWFKKYMEEIYEAQQLKLFQ